MAKNGRGFFGQLFRFDRKRETDSADEENSVAAFSDCSEEKDDGDFYFDDDLGLGPDGEEDISWRSFCEDGSEYGIFPEEFETEEEYEDALCKRKKEAEDAEEDFPNLDVDPDDLI